MTFLNLLFFQYAHNNLQGVHWIQLTALPYQMSLIILYCTLASHLSKLLGDFNGLLLLPLAAGMYFLPINMGFSIATLVMSIAFSLSKAENRNYGAQLLSLSRNDIEPISDIAWLLVKGLVSITLLTMVGMPLSSLGFTLTLTSRWMTIKTLFPLLLELMYSYLTPLLTGLSVYNLSSDSNSWRLYLSLLMPNILLYCLMPSFGLFDMASQILWALLLWHEDDSDEYMSVNLHVAASNHFLHQRMLNALAVGVKAVPAISNTMVIYKSVNLMFDIAYVALKKHELDANESLSQRWFNL